MKGAGFEPHCRLVYPAHILEPDAQNPLPALVSVFTIYPMISNLGVGTPLGVFLWRVSTGGCGSVRFANVRHIERSFGFFLISIKTHHQIKRT